MMFAKRIMRVALTWGMLSGLYLVLVGQASVDEVVAAVLTGAAGTILSVAVRVGSRQAFYLSPRVWLSPLGQALAALPKEIVLVGWHLVRPHPGAGVLEREPVQHAGLDAGSERAAQMLAASVAPNRYVVDRVQGDALLMHRLAAPRS